MREDIVVSSHNIEQCQAVDDLQYCCCRVNPVLVKCVSCGMVTRSVSEVDEVHEASADQRAMVRLVRSTKTEVEKRLADIGCMKLEEIEQYLNCIDKLIELHVDALTMDEYVESTRDYLQRTSWTR